MGEKGGVEFTEEDDTMENHSPALDHVVRLFEDWRATRSGKRPIPEALFDAAYEVRHATSLNRLARILRLNHTRLAQTFAERRAREGAVAEREERPSRRVRLPGIVPPAPGPSRPAVNVTRVVELPQETCGACAEVKTPSGWLLRLSPAAPAGLIEALVGAIWEREVAR